MKTSRLIRHISVVSASFLVLALLLGTSAGPAFGKDPRKTLIIGSVKEAVTLDPHVSFDGQSPLIWRGVYEPLLNLKGDTTDILPGLAKSWEISSDGLVYTFHLQRGVKFHDGSPFTAECAKFSLERAKSLGKGGSYVLGPVTEIAALDDHTLRITLQNPVRSFLSALAGMYTPSYVVKPELVKAHEVVTEQDGEKVSDWGEKYLYDHMLGTGPYRFVRWDHGQQIIMEKFEDY